MAEMAEFSENVQKITFLDEAPQIEDDETETESQNQSGTQNQTEEQKSTTPTPPTDAQTGTQAPAQATTETEDKKAVVVDWNSITNGLVKDETELGTILNEYTNLKNTPKVEVNETENLILDLYRKGENPFKVMALLNTDYEKIAPKEALKQKYIAELSSDFTDEEKELLFESDFLEKYGDSEDRDRVSELKLKQDAKQAQKFLQTEKEKFLNIAKSNPSQNIVEQEQQKALFEKQTKEYEALVSQFSTDFKALEFNVDGNKINVEVDKSVVQKAMREVWDNSIMGRFVNDKGMIDFQKLGTTLAYIDNIENIVKTAFVSGVTNGKDTILKELKNPSDNKPQSTNTTGSKSTAKQMLDQWK